MSRSSRERESSRNFSKLLAELRESHDLSQADVASRLGIDVSTVAKVEAGTRLPFQTSDVLERLSTLPGFTDPQVNLLLESRVNSIKGLTAGEKLLLEEHYLSINPRVQRKGKVSISGLPAINLHLEVLKGDLTYPEELEDMKMMLQNVVRATSHRFRATRPRAT